MTLSEVRIKTLEGKIRNTESKGFASSGCVRKWKREIRHIQSGVGDSIKM